MGTCVQVTLVGVALVGKRKGSGINGEEKGGVALVGKRKGEWH